MSFTSTKTYGHELGLSCCFRQWRAGSHCAKLHGYAIAVKLEFQANELDHRNWVMDFGGLKPVKQFLIDTFDHKTIIAEDDQELDWFIIGEKIGVADLIILPKVGCEAFAEHIYWWVDRWIKTSEHFPRVVLQKVTVSEHGANSASYGGARG